MDYGTRIAMQRAKANAIRKRTAKPRTATKGTTPTTYNTFPLRDLTIDTTGYIDWNSAVTHSAASTLANAYTADNAHMKLLKQPAGTGKTAVAVKTLALIQQHSTTPMSCIILASRAIINQGGWQRTIAEWNADNPDNQLDPILIDTYDRFTNIINHKPSLKDILSLAGDNCILVIDEVHNYKNPTSKRAKALQKIPSIKRLGLSATPLTNDVVLDMGSYLIMAGKYKNKRRYIDETGLAQRLAQDFTFFVYNAQGQIDSRLWPEYDRVVSQLAEVIYQPDVAVTLDQLPKVNAPLSRIEQSPQLAGDLHSLDRAYTKRMFDSAGEYVLEIRKRINTDPARLDWLHSIVTDPTVTQPLVFYWLVSVRDAMADYFDARGIEFQEISGSSCLDDLDPTDTTRPILIQYQAGGEGIEFPLSNTSVFYENQGSYARLVQARGRNVRLGMEHGVTQHYAVSDAPFDSEIFDRVLRREELSDSVLEDIALRVASK